MTRTRPALDLLLASGLVLFLELACIRWFPAHVVFLSFFTNTMLLAGFVGLSVGCLTSRRDRDHIRATPAWLAVAVGSALLVDRYGLKLARVLDLGDQGNPDVVFFGAEATALKPVAYTVPVELFMGWFFVLAALVMVGPGQELGRAFNRVADRGRAYSLNLVGSLAGILLFAGGSALSVGPAAWFAVVAAGVGYLMLRRTGDRPALRDDPTAGPRTFVRLGLLAAAVLGTAWTSGLMSDPVGPTVTRWSPYYRIEYTKGDRLVNTNGAGHQMMHPAGGPSLSPYSLPHMFQRDVAGEGGRRWQPFKRVLVIGAGSGNDVATACMWCGPDCRIDAVEIDPAIQQLGERYHPSRPYADKRVTVHLNDGRNFLRSAPDAEYDLVVFALVDSLVLQSGYSNLRLESYLFTDEAFRDVRRVLKPSGVAAVYNFFRQGWIVARLRETVRGEFGADPVVLTTPPKDDVRLDGLDRGFTVLFAGSDDVVGPLRESFARGENSYWYPWATQFDPGVNSGFGAKPPPLPPSLAAAPMDLSGHPVPPTWVRLRVAEVEESAGAVTPATDDWPFLYVRRPTVPGLTWRGAGLVVLLSLGLWWAFRGRAGSPDLPPSPQRGEGDRAADRGLAVRSLLLGAGFMLIETRAVVEMALLFGSTWVVNTVVFAAVLLMSLAGNRFAGWAKPRTVWPYYLGLFAAVGLGWLVPAHTLLGWPTALQVGLACLLAFLPVLFAGVIFAVSFGRARSPDLMIGANAAGALAGGLAENLSLLIGFRWLLLVAGGIYLGSGLFGGTGCSLPGQSAVYNADDLLAGWVRGTRFGRLVRRVWAPVSPAATGFSAPP